MYYVLHITWAGGKIVYGRKGDIKRKIFGGLKPAHSIGCLNYIFLENITTNQWRTQEFFFGRGSINSVEDREQRMGIWGR
jgi:hypothetical protein